MARFLRQLGVREEPERAEPVVEGDDDRALRGEILAVVPLQAAGAAGEPAAVDPQHHRTPIALTIGAGPDVEREAVLAGRWLPRRLCGCCRLRRCSWRCCCRCCCRCAGCSWRARGRRARATTS